MPAGVFDEWSKRGLVHQHTASGVAEALDGPSLTAYIGFDPTAASLHVGSLLPATMLMRLQRAGHRPIALVGGGTGLVGDPSGKEAERPMLDADALAANVAGLRAQLERFIDFDGPRGALLVDNAEWLGQIGLLTFLRDIGKHFSVNAMIARDSVKRRLETREHGISYTEFSYMCLQAYDYLELYDRLGCTMQMGGSDQWGNIVSGRELIRRLRGGESHGLTWPLLTRADGKKFGKSEAGNVWLDPQLTTPFEFYQFWLNTTDDDVVDLLHRFTFLPLDAIADLARSVAADPAGRAAQRALAEAMTRLVHGDAALHRAERSTRVLFGGGELTELDAAALDEAFRGTPRTTVDRADLDAGKAGLAWLLGQTGLCPSTSRARQDVKSGAVTVNHHKVTDPGYALGAADLIDGAYVVLRRGKKTYHVIEVRG
ncbi:MAG: tyrosine--tRNA ligase [Myxococcales bacterium]|nr:tyrosine--tRNA ligase [Myxococcales bacterium]